MGLGVKRIFVEKKPGFGVSARDLLADIRENLGVAGLTGLRVINMYEVEGYPDGVMEAYKYAVFADPPSDLVYEDTFPHGEGDFVFAVKYLPGQYDQRADSAVSCCKLLADFESDEADGLLIETAHVYVCSGDISADDREKIKKYCINTIDEMEVPFEMSESLASVYPEPADVAVLSGFVNKTRDELDAFRLDLGLAMNADDLDMLQDYFKNEENRDPTVTELRVIDTYWSDHCRHTTFLTEIRNVSFDGGIYRNVIERAFEQYIGARRFVYGDNAGKPVSLMDLATIGMKVARKKGLLDDLDESEEINASSISVKAVVDGEVQEWLVMFKNETHNHPTEIEPFGGAATCLGGAIRDPLSGRSYVYNAMRVTGSGDPRKPVSDTLEGKLPQRKITRTAAAGFSSYGNQIGLATGHVAELYHEGYVAKRMELGAVVGAAKKENVVRLKPVSGDVVVLLGGRTGRDGIGGATGSSKEHTDDSIRLCGAEVQKGNAPAERKLQRLFRNPEAARMIKRCNDFGAGGVSVAIGELADGIHIDLDKVLKKYEGLDGTELAISESQERMAVVLDKGDADRFIKLAEDENLEAVVVARVTDNRRVVMEWRGKVIVDISRGFLDKNGASRCADAAVKTSEKRLFSNGKERGNNNDEGIRLKSKWLTNLAGLDVAAQKGLVERFDSTVGAGTVLMPFGGVYQLTPAQVMSAKLPVESGDTDTCTVMAFGYNPGLSEQSPFHGAACAVVESVSKVVSAGGNHDRVRLSFQEFFGRPGNDPYRFGLPFMSLLGALKAQLALDIPSIGGKDSMSGTFKDLDVPPTLVSFAINAAKVDNIISPEFKSAGSRVVYIETPYDEDDLPDFEAFKKNCELVGRLINEKKIVSAYASGTGGIAAAVSKMAFGNKIGVSIECKDRDLFAVRYGSFIAEVVGDDLPEGLEHLGYTDDSGEIKVFGETIPLDEAAACWLAPLEGVFPTGIYQGQQVKTLGTLSPSPCKGHSSLDPLAENPETGFSGKVLCPAFFQESGRAWAAPKVLALNLLTSGIYGNGGDEKAENVNYISGDISAPRIKTARPTVFMPVFPGTNCEYDLKARFVAAGADVDMFVVKNLNAVMLGETVKAMADRIGGAHIIALPGGFSAGDEPDGSGKYIAAVFRNPYIKEATMKLLRERDGLMLGICNGFQALLKLGLLPYGEICEIGESTPTLTHNAIGRHVSLAALTRIASNKSPWLGLVKVGDVHTIPVSHGEGRFVANEAVLAKLIENGQIATQYADFDGDASMSPMFNPNGSVCAVEGITSPDGRVFGKMGHSERIGNGLYKNIPGDFDQRIFEAGIRYFR